MQSPTTSLLELTSQTSCRRVASADLMRQIARKQLHTLRQPLPRIATQRHVSGRLRRAESSPWLRGVRQQHLMVGCVTRGLLSLAAVNSDVPGSAGYAIEEVRKLFIRSVLSLVCVPLSTQGLHITQLQHFSHLHLIATTKEPTQVSTTFNLPHYQHVRIRTRWLRPAGRLRWRL